MEVGSRKGKENRKYKNYYELLKKGSETLIEALPNGFKRYCSSIEYSTNGIAAPLFSCSKRKTKSYQPTTNESIY